MRSEARRRGSLLWGSVFAALAVITAFTIWSFSMESGRLSNRHSAAVLRLFESFAYHVALLRSILDSSRFTQDELHHTIRKLAHFFEFAAFGFTSQGFLVAIRKLNGHNMVHGASLGLLVAVVDETIQSAHDRGARFTDVLIDFGGVLFGCLLMWVIYGIVRIFTRGRE